eukprot:scaffold1190_cov393-Prasinococcus_capsulatus_cf.AAC.38
MEDSMSKREVMLSAATVTDGDTEGLDQVKVPLSEVLAALHVDADEGLTDDQVQHVRSCQSCPHGVCHSVPRPTDKLPTLALLTDRD